MSKRSPKLFINDMLAAIKKIGKYTFSIKTQEDFVNQDMVVDAVLKNLEIIGEAARAIPDEIKDKNQDIPWKRIIGLRNIVIHGYFVVDLNIVWTIIKEQLPELKEKLERLKREVE